MYRIELADDARDALQGALESYLGDLRYEIGNTDSMDYRDDLKAKKMLLNGILDQLKNARTAA